MPVWSQPRALVRAGITDPGYRCLCSRQPSSTVSKLPVYEHQHSIIRHSHSRTYHPCAFTKAEAVNPPPDGGYPGGNTAEGQSALLSLTTGTYNTAVGFFSLRSNMVGQFNTAVGAGTLLFNVGDQEIVGMENTAVGAAALLFNTGGTDNTAVDAFALLSNTWGVDNVAMGDRALFSNTYGSSNCAFGSGALANNTDGSGNVAVGADALSSNTDGHWNIAIGEQPLLANTLGDNNTAIGFWALRSNNEGSENVAIGDNALFSATGSNNSALGAFAGSEVAGANNVICIGAVGAPVDDSCFIGNIRGVTTQNNDAMPVLVDSAGQLGTANSSERFKTDINAIGKASEAILALNPVSFRYKANKKVRHNSVWSPKKLRWLIRIS